jgi:protein O-mannosyl-transferase
MQASSLWPGLPGRSVLWRLAAVFFAIAAVTYGASVLQNGFVFWDDNYLIYYNPHIKALSLGNIAYNLTHFDPELYVPLTLLSYQLDYLLAGMSAPMFHATNLTLHTLNALLVSLLLFTLSRRGWIAALCGLLFLVHPLNVEAVAWASGRKDVLATFFFLVSCAGYLGYRENGRKGAYWISVGAFLLGLLSKVVIVPLPLVLLLFDLLQRRAPSRAMFVEKLPHFCLAVAFGVLAMFGKQTTVASTTPWETVLMALKSTPFYVQKFLLPLDLSVLYPYRGAVSLAEPAFYVPALATAALIAIAVASLRWGRAAFCGIAFYLLLLIPTFINFSKGGDLYFASDRYGYLPSIGLLLILAFALAKAVPADPTRAARRAKTGITAVIAFVLFAFGLMSARQAETWKDTETLFSNTLEKYPDAVAARVNLAAYYRSLNRLDEAEAQLRQALNYREHTRVYTGLAAIKEKQGKRNEAYDLYQKAIKVDPKDPEPYFGLGILYTNDGKRAQALEMYGKVIELYPGYVGVHNNLAAMYLGAKEYEKAAEEYRKALEIDPYFPDAHFNLGVIAEDKGNVDEAIAHFQEAIDLKPNSADAYYHLAKLSLMKRDVPAAVDAAKTAQRLDPDNEEIRFLLESMRKHGVLP